MKIIISAAAAANNNNNNNKNKKNNKQIKNVLVVPLQLLFLLQMFLRLTIVNSYYLNVPTNKMTMMKPKTTSATTIRQQISSSSSSPSFLFGRRHRSSSSSSSSSFKMAADSEVTFGDLDGTNVRIGIIRTRWNKDPHVDNLVTGIRSALSECNVTETNIFETEVPGSFELPFSARLLALSGTVDAIICTGVLIKGDTFHFEYICDAVSSGIMNVGLQTSIPTIFGVLTCLNEEQVIARSTPGKNNHGEDWGKTAVEMALLKADAFGMSSSKVASGPMGALGFGTATPLDDKTNKKERVGFF